MARLSDGVSTSGSSTLTQSIRNTYIGGCVTFRLAALRSPAGILSFLPTRTPRPREFNLAEDVLVIHRGLALMLCEDAAILEETLRAIKPLSLHVRRLGDRALLVPADEIDGILETLEGEGTFPRLVGSLPEADDPTSCDEAVAEEAL